MNPIIRNGVHYRRVPHPDGGSRVRRFSQDAKVTKQMEAMVSMLREREERDILRAIIDHQMTVGAVFSYWPNRLAELRATLADVDVEPLVEKWITTIRARYPAGDTAAQYHRQVRDLIGEGVPFPSSGLAISALEAWVFSRPVSSGTQLRYHAAMASFCEYLKRTKVIALNPMREVPNPKASDPRVRYIGIEDATRLAEAQDEPFQTMCVLSHSGVEYGAAVAITIRDITPVRHTIHVKGQKTEWRNRMCYIAPWAWPTIERAMHGKLPDAVLCPRVSRTANRKSHAAACEALGLTDYRFHDGRHSYAVRLIQAGTPMEVVARQLGHKDLKMVSEVYGRFRPTEDDAARWEAIAAAKDAEEWARRKA